MKILVVEDEPSIAHIIKKGLQRSGYVVDIIHDGQEAKDRVGVCDYDVMFLDVMLPGADGFEICRHVRNLGLKSKVIMLTARDDIECQDAGRRAGADDYMIKPFLFSDLDAKIHAVTHGFKDNKHK